MVSNEGRELDAHCIHTFGLARFVDFFIFSSFVHTSKPDARVFRLALDLAQVPAQQVLYREDQPLFLDVTASLGIQSIGHESYASTCTRLVAFGLPI